MTTPASAEVGLLGLPLELTTAILQHLAKRDLKALRLTTRSLVDVSTTFLFKNYVLYPHITSFLKLLNISKARSLSSSVRQLEYNVAYRLLPYLLTTSLTAQLGVSRRKLSRRLWDLRDETLVAGNVTDESIEMNFLQDIFAGLSNLESVTVEHNPRGVYIPCFYSTILLLKASQSPCFERTLKRAYSRYAAMSKQSCALTVLASARYLPSLRNCTVNTTDWEHFIGTPDLVARPLFYIEVLGRLKRLELTSSSSNNFPGSHTIINLKSLLALATGLERLKIVFRATTASHFRETTVFSCRGRESCRSAFSLHRSHVEISTDARLTWSRTLTDVDLDGLSCTARELKAILSQCASSLQTLRLHNLTLLPENRCGPKACLVAALEWIRRHLQLNQFFWDGFWTNRGGQNWTIKSEVAQSTPQATLHRRVAEFITSPSDGPSLCPVKHLAIRDGHFDVDVKLCARCIGDSPIHPQLHGDETLQPGDQDAQYSCHHLLFEGSDESLDLSELGV